MELLAAVGIILIIVILKTREDVMSAKENALEAMGKLSAKIDSLQIPNEDATFSKIATDANNMIAALDGKFPPAPVA